MSLINHRLTSADLNLLNFHPSESFLEKVINYYASARQYLQQNHRFLGTFELGVAGSFCLVDFLFEALAFAYLTGEHFESGS